MQDHRTRFSATRRFRLPLFRLPLLGCLLALVAAAPVQAAVTTNVNGNNATVSIDLLGIVGADLSLGFTDAQNLSPSSLGIQVELASLLDSALLSRLPGGSAASLTSAFPLLITIQPPASAGLEFSDTVRVEIHTHNLAWTPGSRLRLFKASLGGGFRDITEAVEAGSVRTRGRTGGFSQFLVLLDLRPTSAVVAEKFDYLQSRLGAASGLSLAERSSLDAALAQSRAASLQGDVAGALTSLDAFDSQVRQLSGSAIPNRWRAGGSLDNIAGDLQGGAATLRFSLGYLRDFGD